MAESEESPARQGRNRPRNAEKEAAPKTATNAGEAPKKTSPAHKDMTGDTTNLNPKPAPPAQPEPPRIEAVQVPPPTTTTLAGESHAPASFPKGFWAGIDYLIHQPEEIFESLRQDHNLWKVSTLLFTIVLAMAAVYGAVMGGTDLLQGAPELNAGQKLALIAIVAVKVPVLFLLTLGIVIPPIYVSNAFMGTRFSVRQVLALLLATTAITATVLASMATVAFFFSLTSQSYHFIKLLHVLIFAYAGIMGLEFMKKCIHYLETGTRRHTPRGLLMLWLILYIFVGTQLGWVLRPFVGSPHEKFQVFRPRSGNFYESVFDSIHRLKND